MSRQKELFESIHDSYYAATSDVHAEQYKKVAIWGVMEPLLDMDAKNVIELAAGNGSLTAWFKQRRPHLNVVGTDVSESACQAYTEMTESPCHLADFTKPFDLGLQFDAAIVGGGIHHFVADLDTAMSNIERLLRPGGCLIMCEPNSDYFLESVRKIWYRLDRKNFDARTEWALSHDKIIRRYSGSFVCEHVRYFGGPAPILMMHNWALRIPNSVKAWYATPVMAVERVWDHLPGRFPFNSFIAKWRRIS